MAHLSLLLTLARDVRTWYSQGSPPDTGISVCDPSAVYRRRNPRASDFYACVEDNFEELERVYDERYSKQHGFWRPIIRHVIHEFLDCGDLRHGFARVWCSACRSEYLLAFSCERRYFCPSCHQKRVVLFAERVQQEVLESVPIRQYVVTIPKMLRIFFKHDRKLLGLLSRCFYQTLKQFLQEVYPERQAAASGGCIAARIHIGPEQRGHSNTSRTSSTGCIASRDRTSRDEYL